jgi:hypothetical protein
MLSIAKTGSLNRRLVYNIPIFERVLVGRTLNVFFGVATVLTAFLIARRLLGQRSALWSALGIALSPTMIVVGHFNTTATLLNLWLLVTLLFLVMSHQGNLGFVFGALGAGVLAFLTKPNGVVALVLVSLFGAWQIAKRQARTGKVPRYLVASVLILILSSGLLMVARWPLLRRVVSTFLWTYEKGAQPVYAWTWLLRYEGILLALGLSGMASHHLDGNIRWPILAAVLIYGLGSLFFQVFYVRWLLPVVTLTAVFAGGSIEHLRSVIPRTASYLVAALVFGAFILTGWNATSLVHNLTTDVREKTWIWIQEHIPPGSRIAVEGLWLHTGVPAQTYRVETLERLHDNPSTYVQDGFNYVTVWGGELDYYNWRAAPSAAKPRERYASLFDQFETVYEGNGNVLHIPVPVTIDILKVPANPVYPGQQLVFGKGWHASEVQESSGVVFRWMTDEGQILYNWPEAGEPTHLFSFDAYVFRNKGKLSVLVNEKHVGPLDLGSPGGLKHAEVPITLSPGLNEIRLISERGCSRPIVFDRNSKDTRCLSIKVANLALGPTR